MYYFISLLLDKSLLFLKIVKRNELAEVNASCPRNTFSHNIESY